MNPRFSIITVCLNAGAALHQTLASVLVQSCADWELIVKDGGSTDGSTDALPADGRIRFFQQSDSGIYDAMNQALAHATGRYVLFLNAGDFLSDDSVLQGFAVTIANAANNSEASETSETDNTDKTRGTGKTRETGETRKTRETGEPGLVYCNYTTTAHPVPVMSPPRLSSFFLYRTMLCHQVCLVRRDYFALIGAFDTSFRVDADYDFLVRLIHVHNARYAFFNYTGIITTPFGFNFHQQETARKEVARIRRSYFGWRRFPYGLMVALTLPRLRYRLSTRTDGVARAYQRFANIINT